MDYNWNLQNKIEKMNLLYYPTDMLKQAIEEWEVNDIESDGDISDEESHTNNFVHLWDKTIKDYLRFNLVITGMPNQRIPLNINGDEDIENIEELIWEKLHMRFDYLNGISSLYLK